VGIAQLVAHEEGEFILCVEVATQLFTNDFGRTCESYCPDVGRILGNFYFSIVSLGTLGRVISSPVREKIGAM